MLLAEAGGVIVLPAPLFPPPPLHPTTASNPRTTVLLSVEEAPHGMTSSKLSFLLSLPM